MGCSVGDAPNCVLLINQDLSQIYLWANGLNINPNKSMILLIGAPENFIANRPPIQSNRSNIWFVRTAKSPGVTLKNLI